MATDRNAKVAAGMSTAAAIASALTLFKGSAAAKNGYVLPEEFVQLIAAIAANTEELIALLSSLGINVRGFPPNAPGINAFTKLCVVVNTPYQGDDVAIPEGMSLLIKSYPGNPLGSIVRVASSGADATNINSSFPLAVNDVASYQVQNANQIYVSANIAGCIAVFSVEKEQ
jgi:hypothetical protein